MKQSKRVPATCGIIGTSFHQYSFDLCVPEINRIRKAVVRNVESVTVDPVYHNIPKPLQLSHARENSPWI